MSAIVLYTDYDYSIYERLMEMYNNILPQHIKDKARKFSRWQDQQAYLLGKLLIWKGLKHFHYPDDCLTKLQTNGYGKPYLDSTVFFNLSHSGQYVICAFYHDEIGIDIEQIKPVEIVDFSTIFSDQEKNHLTSSPDPQKDFYRFWTIKESVIKAEGKGVSIPLAQVNSAEVGAEGNIHFENKIWFVNQVSLFQNYCCSLATRTKPSSLTFEKVNFITSR